MKTTRLVKVAAQSILKNKMRTVFSSFASKRGSKPLDSKPASKTTRVCCESIESSLGSGVEPSVA